MSNELFNTRRARAIIESVKQQYSNANTICPGFLRQDIVLAAGQTSYKFSLQGDQNQQNPPQQLLLRNDNFIVMEMGFFIYHANSAATPATFPANAVLQTYPNARIFAANLERASLNAIYNGTWQLKVDQAVPVNGASMMVYKRVPIRQQSAADVALLPAAATENELALDGEYAGNFGLVATEPLITLKGNKNVELTVNIPNYAAFNPAPAAGSNYLVAFATGLLVAGVNQGS